MQKKSVRIVALCAVIVAIMGVAVMFPGPRPAFAQDQFGSNWTAYYWDNLNFSGGGGPTFVGGPKLFRVDQQINFNWQSGSPDQSIPADRFGARWFNTITFTAGTYRFRLGADDGMRLAVDGAVVIDKWVDAVAGFQVQQVDLPLTAGMHQIIVDYYENVGNAGVQFSWQTVVGGTVPGATPAPGTGGVVVPTSAVKAVVRANLANIRSGPGLSFPLIAEVPKDRVFNVIARNGSFGNQTWFLVQFESNRQGWMFRQTIYLYNDDPNKLPIVGTPADPNVPISDVRGVAKTNITVRDAPSTRGTTRLGVLNRGTSLKILRMSLSRAWVFIEGDGLQGWVFVPNVAVVVGNLGRLPVSN